MTWFKKFFWEKFEEKPDLFFVSGFFAAIIALFLLYNFIFPESVLDVTVTAIPGKAPITRRFSLNFTDPESFGRKSTGFGMYIYLEKSESTKFKTRFLRKLFPKLDVYLHIHGPIKYKIDLTLQGKKCKTYNGISLQNFETNPKVIILC